MHVYVLYSHFESQKMTDPPRTRWLPGISGNESGNFSREKNGKHAVHHDIWWHLEMYIALVILSLPLDVFITFGYNHVQDLAVLWHIRHSETICHLQGSYPKNKHDCLMVHRNCGLVHPIGLVQVWLGWTNPPWRNLLSVGISKLQCVHFVCFPRALFVYWFMETWWNMYI